MLARAFAREVQFVLERSCRPDPAYPEGMISSIYFDTPGLDYVDEKLNSDYLKTKVRGRWYRRRHGADDDDGVWAEAKIRIGSRRRKVRRLTGLRASVLENRDLDLGKLAAIPRQLQAVGVPVRQPLLPLLRIRYRRRRFVEPHSHFRISLDTEIAADWANPLFAVHPTFGTLKYAVVELKGPSRFLPPSLRSLARLSIHRGSFSKYAACVETLSGLR